jgi:dienelactone hydrolase
MKLKIITIFFLLVTSSLHAEELVTLKTRTGVEQRFILIKPEKPVASVILFAGGKGALDLSSLLGSPTINWGKNNFLVRTRDLFAKNDFIVAVVDAPSDKQTKKGMLGGFRDSQEHVEDIDQVIDYLRKQADIPVWLIGTSRGTESATSIAINSNKQPYGLVLTSSMSVSNDKGTPVNDMDLEKIQVPTLIVANTDDGCNKTPPEGAQEIAGKLISSKKIEVKMYSGGDKPISKPCNAMSYHGFLGLENSVVDFISTFIKNN